MKILSFFILSSALMCHSAFAQNMTVQAEQLRNLSLQTNPIESVSSYAGKDVMATVAILPGRSYAFKSPINVQRIQYLKGVGETLKENEAFAIIQGPEVHHFYRTFELTKVLFLQTQTLFNNSKKLYQRKSLSEQAWLDVSNQYNKIRMEYDELTHFFDLVINVDEAADSLTLGAPMAGIIQYNLPSALDTDDTIASFAPTQALRLRVNIPIDASQKPLLISSGGCQLAVDFTENANSPFYQIAWTKALTNDCAFAVGQVLSATPEYQADAYEIKQSSVFNWEGDNYIFIQDKQNYTAVKISLITAHDSNYIVKSSVSLAGKNVLLSSVSAVQGILLGLGI